MPSLFIHHIATDDPRDEDPAATRERLKDRFARGATRRMTQLGLLLGSVLRDVPLAEDDTVVYLSEYAETRALEAYLDGFPAASPTLFQTSIHPSAVQQNLIQHQKPLRAFFPLTGRPDLLGAGLSVAHTATSSRIVLCGGEERGTWLLEKNAASPRAFAFALSLSRDSENALGQLDFADADTAGALPEFFDALHQRKNWEASNEGGGRITLSWR